MFVTLPAAARKAPNISALFPLLPDKDVEIVGVLRSAARATGGHSNINQLHCAFRVSLGGENINAFWPDM